MNRVRKRIHLEELQQSKWSRYPITIAVLDSGISRHPDLEGKCMVFQDFLQHRKNPYDDNGHGTHVCGILCGSGEASKGEYRGIIPSARLVVGKVLDQNGEGQADVMIKALDWLLENRKRYDVRLLNISVGIGNLKDKQKMLRLKTMVEALWDSGVVVVCAAGNKGPAPGSISDIGGSQKVITVGCYDDMPVQEDTSENCEAYSGRGRLNADIRKPDIVAPGSHIMSCCHECEWIGNAYDKLYSAKSGTSMATPIVTGCAALLLQEKPYLKNIQVKDCLHYSAEDLNKPWNLQGWGMIHAKSLLENT